MLMMMMKQEALSFLLLSTIFLSTIPLIKKRSSLNSSNSSFKSHHLLHHQDHDDDYDVHKIKKRRINRRSSNCKPKNQSNSLSGKTFKSQGTQWGGDWKSGNCAYEMWPRPSNLGYIAIGSSQWNEASSCGQCISIEGPTGETFIGIVGDQCLTCVKDGLDLDTPFWDQVSGGQEPGIIDISWSFISCSFSKGLELVNNEGTSQDWISIQILQSNTFIKSLEISKLGGGKESDWKQLKLLSESNYWQQVSSENIGDHADIKVTCPDGKSFIIKNVDIATPRKIHSTTFNCN